MATTSHNPKLAAKKSQHFEITCPSQSSDFDGTKSPPHIEIGDIQLCNSGLCFDYITDIIVLTCVHIVNMGLLQAASKYNIVDYLSHLLYIYMYISIYIPTYSHKISSNISDPHG